MRRQFGKLLHCRARVPSGFTRLCDVVPESLRHYLENIQSMIKDKADLENMLRLPAAYWDPVLKRNRAKRMKLFARLLEIGLLRPPEARDPGTRIVNWVFVSPPGVSLCSSEMYGSN